MRGGERLKRKAHARAVSETLGLRVKHGYELCQIGAGGLCGG